MTTVAEPNSLPAPAQLQSITVTTAPPAPDNPNKAKAADAPPGEYLVPWLTFPPFPQAPAGVDLVPFSAFKPSGLPRRVEPTEPDYVERDALGIPTVSLKVHHDLTGMEKRKRKKGKGTVTDSNGVVRRMAWYDEWAEGEQLRRTATVIDPYVSLERALECTAALKLIVASGTDLRRVSSVCTRQRTTSNRAARCRRTRSFHTSGIA